MYQNLYQFIPAANDKSDARSVAALPDAALINDDWLDRLGNRVRSGVAGALDLAAAAIRRLAPPIAPSRPVETVARVDDCAPERC